jgi:hypothetical protein
MGELPVDEMNDPERTGPAHDGTRQNARAPRIYFSIVLGSMSNKKRKKIRGMNVLRKYLGQLGLQRSCAGMQAGQMLIQHDGLSSSPCDSTYGPNR